MSKWIHEEDRHLIWSILAGFIVFFSILSLAGCTSYIQHSEWTPSDSYGSPGDKRECRLLYTKDWTRSWLECRYCVHSGEHVECPR